MNSMNNPNLSGLGLPQPLVDAIRLIFSMAQTDQNAVTALLAQTAQQIAQRVSGAGNLLIADAIPKVSTPGVLTDSAVKTDAAGDILLPVSAVVKINGDQVVNARGAALTAATAYGGGVAGGTYTWIEQALINALISQVLNLKTRLDQVEARLSFAAGGSGTIP